MICRTSLLIALAGCSCFLACAGGVAGEPDMQLAVWRGPQLTRLDLQFEFDGRTLASVWDENFARLVAFYDRNGDGLSEAEAARLPSAAALREVAALGFIPQLGEPPAWRDLNPDSNDVASVAEVATCYRKAGRGAPQVAIGVMPFSSALTQALVRQWDSDGDMQVTASELHAAPASAAKLDQNGDELVGAGELVPRVLYPGVAGGWLLSPPRASKDADHAAMSSFSLMLLPRDPQDDFWASRIAEARDNNGDHQLSLEEAGLESDAFHKLDNDRNGFLSAAELAKWRLKEPDHAIDVALALDASQPPRLARPVDSDSPGLRNVQVVAAADPGLLATAMERVAAHFSERFQKTDFNSDRIATPDEVATDDADWRWLVPTADRDEDERLSLAELEAWLEVQRSVAACQATVTILDAGNGLFELLDTTRDGALSVAELSEAGERLQAAGCVSDGKLDVRKLPQTVLITVSPGYPRSPLGRQQRRGPAWFLAMDRNADGMLSKSEFTAPPATFGRLDLSQDGYLDANEASKVNEDQ